MSDETATKLAVVLASVARAQITVAAMQAENAQRAATGAAPAYTEQSFLAVIDQENIGWNAVLLEMRP